jgi:hypothetical protein
MQTQKVVSMKSTALFIDIEITHRAAATHTAPAILESAPVSEVA